RSGICRCTCLTSSAPHRLDCCVLLPDALDQALLGEHHVDLDPGLVGELLEERIDKVRLAIRIDVHLAKVGGVSDRSGEGRREKRKRESAREWKSHHFLQWPEFKAPGSD